MNAEFVMENGRPGFIEVNGRNHYRIRLSVEGAPLDTMTVTYNLHETYKHPTRLVPAGVPDFQEFLTSYGDYPIRVLARRKSDPNNVELLAMETLSVALRRTHGSDSSAAMVAALQDIADN